MNMEISSSSFAPGNLIPKIHTGDGKDISPVLSWTNLPAATKELALVVDDPDAPTEKPWVHWVIYNIPASTKGFSQGIPQVEHLETVERAVQGKNSWNTVGYRGPAPPIGHGLLRYHFKLYALDQEYSAPAGLDKDKRQRVAVGRAAVADHARRRRSLSRLAEPNGAPSLFIDGYNLLTTVESALGGGVILRCRDATYRDMASMHGTYRKVAETSPALQLIGRAGAEFNIQELHWYLDRPVSNSGKLKTIMLEAAEEHGFSWKIELVGDPDQVLAQAAGIVVSADSFILNACERWFNFARLIIERYVPQAFVVDLEVE